MLAYLLILAAVVNAVYVGWPMDEQLPNVVRVDLQYSFTIASITYKSSTGGSITYSVSGLPDWLTFDSDSRTFSGLPSLLTVGKFSISLTGTDSVDNSSLSNSYDMLVSNDTGIELSSDDVMFTQIAAYGRTNGQDGLVVREGQQFSIQFSKLTFKLELNDDQPISVYYGRSLDRTSLPNWVNFNLDTLTFSGTVPYVTSLIAPSVEYGFLFISSDHAGFAGAEGIFKLVVGAHELSTLLNETIKLNGTYGSHLDFTAPVLTSVFLDGLLIDTLNISTVVANNLPSWMLFDSSSYDLLGTYPDNATFENFTVAVTDVFGNSVSLPFLIDSLDSVFTIDELPDANATRGEYFQLQLMKSIFTDYNDTAVSVSVSNSSDLWLSYHASNLTLQGQTPKNFGNAQVVVKADSKFDTEERSFNIRGVNKLATSSTTSSSSSLTLTLSLTLASSVPASTTSSSATHATHLKSSNSNHKKLVLGLAIGIPGLALLLALLLILFCCVRRRKRDDSDEEKRDSVGELNGPGFGTTHDIDDHEERAHKLDALGTLDKLNETRLSTLSSVTHVESEDDSRYFDALDKPMKSWRANDASDSSEIKKKILEGRKHTSGISMDTVNTEKLFSVRLVDDNVNRTSTHSLGIFLQNSLLTDSSGNIQRLDSDGNIAELTLLPGGKSLQPSTKVLNSVEEENSADNTFYNTTHESSNYNLMARFMNENSPAHSTRDAELQESLAEEFRPVRTSLGDIEWAKSEENLVSPNSSTFLLRREETPINNSQTADPFTLQNFSRTSLYSEPESRGGSKAKLVNFTRKASLRESAKQQEIQHSGETAQIHDEDSE